MDDPEIQETVEQILGKRVKVVDCEKKSSIKEEEVLLINGVPVALEGKDGMAIKQALITGQVPPCDLLNTLLIKTGILRAPVKLDTSLSVKSTTVTKEEVTVSRDGKVVDERSRETKEHNYYTSATTEVYEPVRIIPTAELEHGHHIPTRNGMGQNGKHGGCGSDHKLGSYSSASSYESSEGPIFVPKSSLGSKDSGNLSNSMSTTKADCTPSSIGSFSSLDETDFKNDLIERFRKCGFNGVGYSENYTVSISHKSITTETVPFSLTSEVEVPTVVAFNV